MSTLYTHQLLYIDNIFVRQIHKNGKVTLNIEVETKHNTDCDIYVAIDNKEIKLDENKRGTVVIDNPKLWWARGYGEQNLYDVTVTLLYGETVCDTYSFTYGIRTMELERTEITDSDGNGEFCFRVNGKKIFVLRKIDRV